ncbi:MAG: DHA2 family efflux MFS transporter permease subunit [Halioglobus sp.]
MTSAKLEDYLALLNTNDEIKGLYRRFGLGYGWWVMATITLANVATLIAGTIINVAIPDIMGAFGIGQDKAQWLATAFLASSTITMLLNSWFIRAVGMRGTVVGAVSVFMAGSLLGSVSPNMDLLILARILQGAATGILTPMSMSLVFLLFPAGKHGAVMGITAIGVVLAPAIGPVLGGVLIDSFNWRYVYLMGVPISLVVLPLAATLMPGRDRSQPRPPLDWLGLSFLTIAICGLLIALSNGQREGWSSNFVVLWFAASGIGTALFFWWENLTEHPLLELRVFTFYRFSVISALGFIFGAGLYGSTYLIPLFLQLVQNVTPTNSGLMMLPAALLMGAIFPFSGRLSDRMDQRILLGTGFAILAYSSYLMVGASTNTSLLTFTVWMMISRIGIGLLAPTLNLSAIQGLPMEYLQQGAGAMNFIRQLGGAFGVNLLSVSLESRSAFHRDAMFAAQTWGHSDSMEMVYTLQRELQAAGLSLWDRQYVAFGTLGRIVGEQALVKGFQDGFMFMTVIFALALVPLALLRSRHMRKKT